MEQYETAKTLTRDPLGPWAPTTPVQPGAPCKHLNKLRLKENGQIIHEKHDKIQCNDKESHLSETGST